MLPNCWTCECPAILCTRQCWIRTLFTQRSTTHFIYNYFNGISQTHLILAPTCIYRIMTVLSPLLPALPRACVPALVGSANHCKARCSRRTAHCHPLSPRIGRSLVDYPTAFACRCREIVTSWYVKLWNLLLFSASIDSSIEKWQCCETQGNRLLSVCNTNVVSILLVRMFCIYVQLLDWGVGGSRRERCDSSGCVLGWRLLLECCWKRMVNYIWDNCPTFTPGAERYVLKPPVSLSVNTNLLLTKWWRSIYSRDCLPFTVLCVLF